MALLKQKVVVPTPLPVLLERDHGSRIRTIQSNDAAGLAKAIEKFQFEAFPSHLPPFACKQEAKQHLFNHHYQLSFNFAPLSDHRAPSP